MKKPVSLQPSVSRMQLRMRELPSLPPAARARLCYCGGASKQDFCAAVNRGDAAAVNLALDVVAAELWLGEHDAGRYGRPLRAALRRACQAGVLPPEQKRVLLSIELRNWKRLVLRARHSEPGDAQQRASRRLPGQRLVLLRCFGLEAEVTVDSAEWPAVTPPLALLQKGVQRGWFSTEVAEKLAASSYEVLMELLHPPIEIVDSRSPGWRGPLCPDETAQIPESALCYHFGCEKRNSVRWVVAPWGELRQHCGLILAADGSFGLNHDEWGRIVCHGAEDGLRQRECRSKQTGGYWLQGQGLQGAGELQQRRGSQNDRWRRPCGL